MKPDNRYTITREYCGHPEPRYIARFCGEWLGQSYNKSDAERIAADHAEARQKAMDAQP